MEDVFSNPNLLMEVFSHLPSDQFTNIQNVNGFWADLSMRVLEKRFQTFNNFQDLLSFIQRNSRDTNLKLESVIFNGELRAIDLNNRANDLVIILKFLKSFGAGIQSITFNRIDWNLNDPLCETVSEILRQIMSTLSTLNKLRLFGFLRVVPYVEAEFKNRTVHSHHVMSSVRKLTLGLRCPGANYDYQWIMFSSCKFYNAFAMTFPALEEFHMDYLPDHLGPLNHYDDNVGLQRYLFCELFIDGNRLMNSSRHNLRSLTLMDKSFNALPRDLYSFTIRRTAQAVFEQLQKLEIKYLTAGEDFIDSVLSIEKLLKFSSKTLKRFELAVIPDTDIFSGDHLYFRIIIPKLEVIEMLKITYEYGGQDNPRTLELVETMWPDYRSVAVVQDESLEPKLIS